MADENEKYIADSYDVSIMIAQILLSDKEDVSKIEFGDVLDILDIPFFDIPDWVIPIIEQDAISIYKGSLK
jgi:hypothetical protein